MTVYLTVGYPLLVGRVIAFFRSGGHVKPTSNLQGPARVVYSSVSFGYVAHRKALPSVNEALTARTHMHARTHA